ncbi:MAG: hypothetical protein R6V23_01075 [Bacteroidales bacterium]
MKQKTMKYLFTLIIISLLGINCVLAQNIETRVFEPEKVETSKIYKHSDIIMNVFLMDKRSSSDLFRQQIFSAVEFHFKEGFPETRVNIIDNIREISSSEPNRILVIIDIVDYFVAKNSNKWIGKTSFDIKVFDYREENVKEFNKLIIHTETKPDRESLNSARQALAASFNKTVKNAKKFVEHSIRNEKEHTFVD